MTVDAWISLAAQVPLVGIFVWFTLQQQKLGQDSQAKRDHEWREFLREQREANNAAMARLAEEIKAISGVLASVQALMVSHDTRVQAAMPDMREAVDKIKIRRRT